MLFLHSTYIKLHWNRTVGQNVPSVSMDDARTEVFFSIKKSAFGGQPKSIEQTHCPIPRRKESGAQKTCK